MPAVIETRDLTKAYGEGPHMVLALRGANLRIEEGEFVAITGPSGSGKSTLMNILGCLDVPTSGFYYLSGVEVSQLTDDELAGIRSEKIGFVFQSFNLLPRLAALGQVELPLLYRRGEHGAHRRELALAALRAVDMGHRLSHRPTELSGGEQQRVAIARALITNPRLILADEPTGNLDTRSSHEVMDIFARLNAEEGITIFLVTHEDFIAAYARRHIRMRDGLIEADELAVR